MKNIVIAAVLLGAAAVFAHMYVVAQRYYPMVKVAAPEGLTYIAVQDATSERQACGIANDRFLVPIKASCKECKVIQARCERVVEGDEEKKLLEGTPIPNYLIVAPGVRMAIEGPDASARRDCDFVAKDIASRGVTGAVCIYPKAPRA
jgi:orotidine-5'-phosphate decarboxylase